MRVDFISTLRSPLEYVAISNYNIVGDFKISGYITV